MVGWLLYSHRSINTQALAEAFYNKYGVRIAFRFQNISTGSTTTPSTQLVRALHIITAANDLEQVKPILQSVYNMKAKTFPFGIRMRFVPWISWNNKPRIQQVMELRDRQATFVASVNHMASWEITTLDKSRADLPTLREMIMSMTSTHYPQTPLFLSIDQAWNNPGVHVLAFMPRMEAEARHAVTTLLPFLKHKYKNDNVELYFSQSAKQRAIDTMWDEDLQQVVTTDELFFDKVHATAMEDDEWFGLTAPTTTSTQQPSIVNLTPATMVTPSSVRMENVFYGDEKDSVGTVRTGATGPPVTGDIQVSDEASQGQTGSFTGTVESRVSQLEANILGLSEALNRMTSHMTDFQDEFRTAFRSVNSSSYPASTLLSAAKTPSPPQTATASLHHMPISVTKDSLLPDGSPSESSGNSP
jgi:hypothetical protein